MDNNELLKLFCGNTPRFLFLQEDDLHGIDALIGLTIKYHGADGMGVAALGELVNIKNNGKFVIKDLKTGKKQTVNAIECFLTDVQFKSIEHQRIEKLNNRSFFDTIKSIFRFGFC